MDDIDIGLEGMGICEDLPRSESYHFDFAASSSGMLPALSLLIKIVSFWLVVGCRARRLLRDPLIDKKASRERRPRVRPPEAERYALDGKLFLDASATFWQLGQPEQLILFGEGGEVGNVLVSIIADVTLMIVTGIQRIWR